MKLAIPVYAGLALASLALGCGCPTEKAAVADRKATATLRHQSADGVVTQLAGGGAVDWFPAVFRAGILSAPSKVKVFLGFGDRAFAVRVFLSIEDVGMGPSEIDLNDERSPAADGELGAPYHGLTGRLSIASLTNFCHGDICVLRASGTFTLSASGAEGQTVEVTDGMFSANDRIIDRPLCPQS